MIAPLLMAAAMFAQAAPAAAPAAAASAAPSAAPPAAGAPKDLSGVTVTGQKKGSDPTEVVCHSEPVLGSMFPKKVCASRQAIAERRDQDQAELRKWTALRPGVSN